MLNSEPILRWGPGIFPLRSFNIRMDKIVFKKFEMQMHKFASTFAFENKSKFSSPDPYDIFFIFRRSDIDLLGSNDSESGQPDLKFSVGFYPKESQVPPPAENVNVLVEGLMAHLKQVEGAAVTEITKPQK